MRKSIAFALRVHASAQDKFEEEIRMKRKFSVHERGLLAAVIAGSFAVGSAVPAQAGVTATLSETAQSGQAAKVERSVTFKVATSGSSGSEGSEGSEGRESSEGSEGSEGSESGERSRSAG